MKDLAWLFRPALTVIGGFALGWWISHVDGTIVDDLPFGVQATVRWLLTIAVTFFAWRLAVLDFREQIGN